MAEAPAPNDPNAQVAPPTQDQLTPTERAVAKIAGNAPAAPAEPLRDSQPSSATPQEQPATEDPRLARLYGQTAKMEQQMRQLAAHNKRLQGQVDGFQTEREEWDSDPYGAAAKRGLDPREWVASELGLDEEAVRDKGEIALEKLERLEQAEEDRAAQAETNRAQVRVAELRGHVGKFLEENEFGAVRASPAAVENITSQVRQMEVNGEFAGMEPEQVQRVISSMATDVQEALQNEVRTYLQAPGALAALLKDEATLKVIRAELGSSPQPTAGTPPVADGARNEPRTIDNRMASEPGTRERTSGGGPASPTPFGRERSAAVALERAMALRKAAV